MDLNNTISLVVGDSGGDGHGVTETIIYKTNLSIDELKEAYSKGKEATGINIWNIASDYGDTDVPEEMQEAVRNILGITKEEVDKYGFFPDSEYDFADLYMKVAQVGNTELEYEQLTFRDSIYIGGYGFHVT